MIKNSSIKNKIFFLVAFVLVISVSIVGWYGFEQAKKSYIKSAYDTSDAQIESLSSKINGILGTIPADIIYNSNFYALKKLIIWKNLKDKEQIKKWEDIYKTTLKDYLVNKRFYYQVRVLDINGKEQIVLKYDKKNNKVIDLAKKDLQDKSNRNYFKKAIHLKEGQFYVSPMNLNIEHGVIERPYIPVIRYSMPIINTDGVTKGVIVLNLDANTILKLIAKKDTAAKNQIEDIHLVNKEGYYLYHDDFNKRWGFQLDNDNNFFLEHRHFVKKLVSKDKLTITGKDKIFSIVKIYPDKINNYNRFWYLVYSIDKDNALASLDRFIFIFAMILISVLFVSFIIINGYIAKLVKPLEIVTDQLQALASGSIKKEKIKYNANDEIGKIVRFTNILVDSIEMTIKQANSVAHGNFKDEIVLKSENDRLGKALVEMTNRLKKITSLATSLSHGNYDTKIELNSKDDQLGLALIDMINYLKNITDVAESISIGEIDIEYHNSGKHDRLGNAMSDMILYLKNILEQSKAIANNNFETTIQSKGKTDELGNALITMTEILSTNSIKNIDDIWFSKGLGEFSNKISGLNDIESLAQESISNTCRYLNIASGAIYNFNKSNKQLNIIGTFSYSDIKQISNNFNLGDGVIGQVALEKKSILLTNNENEEFTINSGLNNIKAKEIYVVPLIHENKLFGVIELLSLTSFTELHKHYIQKVASILATALYSTNQNVKIKKLLDDSNKAYDELEIKSKEIQVQSEKLKSSNEQMEDQQMQLQIQSANLQIKNIEIEKAKAEIDKKAQDLEASNKYKSEFLANMSHELRTPLNSIILLSSLLSKNNNKNLDSNDIKKADVINESGNELLRLINDILDLSKIESGKMELIIDEIDTKEFLDNHYEVFQHTAINKNLEFKIIDNINGKFYNDKDRLGQIVKNLISNAFKFTQSGSVTLQFDKTDDDKLPIKVSVIDTGLGIPKKKQDLIFKAFTQADGSTSREFGGTGLGLSISRDLSHLMKGEIILSSIEDEGSTFSILLPTLFDQFTSEKKIQQMQVSSKNIKKTTIKEQCLIVEDDKEFANVLKEIIEEHNCTAFIAYDGKSALELVKKHKISAAIVDIGLPDMSGLELIKKFKNDSVTKDINIQIMSGHEKSSLDMTNIVIDGYLQKPVSYNQIKKVIDTISENIKKELKSLLIVEDNLSHLNAVKEYLLEDNNLEIVTSLTVKDAKEIIKSKYFDVAIIDLGLGEDSGIQICETLRAQNEDTIIFIYTGRDLSKEDMKFLNTISDEIIIKNPNSHKLLKNEINKFITTSYQYLQDNIITETDIDYSKIDTTNLNEKTVLIVDDDIKNIFVLTSALQEFNMKILNAKNGKEALTVLENNKDIDIVLMDIMMPIMNGYEAMKEIRKDDKLKHLPVIAVTAKAMQKDEDEAMDAGATNFLTKPINLEKLSVMMSNCIDK